MISTKYLSIHERQLPLRAQRLFLDALTLLSQPRTPERLRRAARLAEAATDRMAEISGIVGYLYLRSQLVEYRKTLKPLRDGADVFVGDAAYEVLCVILVRVASVLRACVDDRLWSYLPDATLRATGATEIAESIIAACPIPEFSFCDLPPRTDANPVAAFTDDLRKYATWLRNYGSGGPRKDTIAWVIEKFDGRGGDLRPVSVIGLLWRGHTVAVTQAELDAAGYRLNIYFDEAAEAFERLATIVDARWVLS
jgi:hypothetical protein